MNKIIMAQQVSEEFKQELEEYLDREIGGEILLEDGTVDWEKFLILDHEATYAYDNNRPYAEIIHKRHHATIKQLIDANIFSKTPPGYMLFRGISSNRSPVDSHVSPSLLYFKDAETAKAYAEVEWENDFQRKMSSLRLVYIESVEDVFE